MIDITRSRDHEIRGIESSFVIISRNFVVKTPHRFRGSSDRNPERMSVAKKCLAENLAKIFLRRVLDHLHLLDDYALFRFEIALIESWIHEHVGYQIKGAR